MTVFDRAKDFPSDPESCQSDGRAIKEVDVAGVVAMKFSKGDRVKLSAEGLAKLPRPNHPRHVDRTDRRGTVAQISKSGSAVYVLWDDRRSTEALHGAFLEHADGVSETRGVLLSLPLSS
jgi:hypothetical protein